MNNLDIAKIILETANTELHVDEIAKKALEGALIQGISLDSLASKLSSALSLSVKRTTTPFAKVKNKAGGFKRGVYRLKRTRPTTIEPSIPEPSAVEDTGFIGKGGEYAVMSELLFRGFNVSLMSVDKGIDIVAANEKDKYFHLQVKTANPKDGIFQFGIRRKSFDANHSSQTFYVFVLRKEFRCDYVIMPNSQIANFVALGVIRGQDTLSMRITYDSKTRKYSLNNSQDISIFVNRFGQIC
ncbi:hypothetical protein GBK02_10280 [Dechloromonas sp. TW-R-39-2]|uniref:hypothetical protein n=1 Tax=Dechloromonas sp. TW-R-39-2 TaxID=2654218 RepID=UPI00193CFB94|nr:hypothetical protein [Dechloromonas sp. TW-R-39-2]QRM19761.1 hypothetical protein GBK02_10280 [Dechloromonas sp. TW-R-39-2]